jgi:succinate dehydrogenase / fumarate reductase, cytochrome b subunit
MAPATDRAGARPRPLSPHLQIYSPLVNMVMSIIHRITGFALYLGTVLLVWWLVAAATGPAYFAYVTKLLGHPLGLVVLVGYTWALVHHMLGGVRHFIWDTGRGFDLKTINMLCWGTLVGSLAITGGIWGLVLRMKGII